jgi:hypothetical protein
MCDQAGVVTELLSPLYGRDILLQMNILELLPPCFCAHLKGVRYLLRSGVMLKLLQWAGGGDGATSEGPDPFLGGAAIRVVSEVFMATSGPAADGAATGTSTAAAAPSAPSATTRSGATSTSADGADSMELDQANECRLNVWEGVDVSIVRRFIVSAMALMNGEMGGEEVRREEGRR